MVRLAYTVCHGDSFRALRERYYRLDTKNLTSSKLSLLEKRKMFLTELEMRAATPPASEDAGFLAEFL